MSELAIEQIEIRPVSKPIDAEIQIPGSKSITNRALLLTALAEGTSTLENALFSDDSRVFVDCLRRMGISVETDEEAATMAIHGQGGEFPSESADLFVGNSGTTARFMTAAATLAHGDFR